MERARGRVANADVNSGRQTLILVAVLALLVASIFPACDAICCSSPADTSIHAAMPCCNTQPKLERVPSGMRVPPAVTATAPAQATIPVAVATVSLVHAPVAVAQAVEPAHHEPSPPLFLRNSQLLI
jgi:hypothetical protein